MRHVQLTLNAWDRREKQEYAGLEDKIDKWTEDKEAMEQELFDLSTKGTKYEEIQQLSEKLAALSAKIDKESDRWLELAERDEYHAALQAKQ